MLVISKFRSCSSLALLKWMSPKMRKKVKLLLNKSKKEKEKKTQIKCKTTAISSSTFRNQIAKQSLTIAAPLTLR